MLKFREFLIEDQAKEGEGPVLWHLSTKKKLTGGKFRPLTHFGDQNAARERGVHLNWNEGKNPKSVHAVRIKHGNSFKIDDLGAHHPHDLNDHLHEKGLFNSQEHQQHRDNLNKMLNGGNDTTHHMAGYHPEEHASMKTKTYMANAIRSKGYQSLHYKNNTENKGSTSHIITHPDQVRTIKSRSSNRLKVRGI